MQLPSQLRAGLLTLSLTTKVVRHRNSHAYDTAIKINLISGACNEWCEAGHGVDKDMCYEMATVTDTNKQAVKVLLGRLD